MVIPTSGFDLAAALRGVGLRVTGARVAVLSEVAECKHMTAQDGARPSPTPEVTFWGLCPTCQTTPIP